MTKEMAIANSNLVSDSIALRIEKNSTTGRLEIVAYSLNKLQCKAIYDAVTEKLVMTNMSNYMLNKTSAAIKANKVQLLELYNRRSYNA